MRRTCSVLQPPWRRHSCLLGRDSSRPRFEVVRSLNTAVLFLLAFLSGLVLHAADPLPTGEAILDKYLEVTGGKAAYEKKQTEIQSAVMEFVGKGVKANMTIYHAAPNKSYSVAEIE